MKIGIVAGENPRAKELSKEIKAYITDKGQEAVSEFNDAEAVIVLGGDGSLIHTTCEHIELGIPFFGINMGTLGFLTASEGDNWQEAVDKILSGDYVISERMTLESDDFRALNEIVVKGIYRVIDLDILVSGEKFMNIVGDGVIISTQTGSTAYSLSAGGPIVDPEVDCILVTPVNAHGLPVPSVVLSPDAVVEVKINKGTDISLIVDGSEHMKVEEGKSVKVTRGKHRVKLGYFDKHQFLKALNKKFGLASRSSL